MPSNSFGTLFRITTWGESHGRAVGVLIDGCPAGLLLEEEEITAALARRAPGRTPYTSPRREPDRAQLLSGVFEGRTTGAPLSILILNSDVDSASYEPLRDLQRPGHASYTYLAKYGLYDHRGGGRASARETACRVAAGCVAQKLLREAGVSLLAWLAQVGSTVALPPPLEPGVRAAIEASSLFCPDPVASEAMAALIAQIKEEGDSIGGLVAFAALGVPAGWGDPVYEKLEAKLAAALMGLPASKGFEIGEGFGCVALRGSEHNDAFSVVEGRVAPASNRAGGLLGGIATGLPLTGRVAFKPTSSIRLPQRTATRDGREALLELPKGARHDPCVAIRAVPVVEAMVALVLADAMLLQRSARL